MAGKGERGRERERAERGMEVKGGGLARPLPRMATQRRGGEEKRAMNGEGVQGARGPETGQKGGGCEYDADADGRWWDDGGGRGGPDKGDEGNRESER